MKPCSDSRPGCPAERSSAVFNRLSIAARHGGSEFTVSSVSVDADQRRGFTLLFVVGEAGPLFLVQKNRGCPTFRDFRKVGTML